MSDYKAIKLLKSLLKNKDKWELYSYIPTNFEKQGQKAIIHASKKLTNISLLSFWRRYKIWVGSEPQISDCDDYFHTFIAQVAFDMAMDVLDKEERNRVFYF